MTELATLARPYAHAVYHCALQNTAFDKWSEQLALLSAVADDALINKALHNPKISKQQVSDLLTSLTASYLNGEGQNLLKLLIRNRRVGLLPEIARLFEALRAEHEGYLETDVYAAFPLSEHEQQNLTEALTRRFGKSIRIRAHEDRSLIGGVLIRAGDKVIDGSVKGRLQNLAKRL
ncbi:MAG: F0F1 ATP synthase subunit delta [Methylococcales bacterium]|nr:F0F1 ATP synthase subunit delta [Methylococcales bacterium]